MLWVKVLTDRLWDGRSTNLDDFKPLVWSDYFSERQMIDGPNEGEKFCVYTAGTSGPVFFLLHGAGMSSLSWGMVAVRSYSPLSPLFPWKPPFSFLTCTNVALTEITGCSCTSYCCRFPWSRIDGNQGFFGFTGRCSDPRYCHATKSNCYDP